MREFFISELETLKVKTGLNQYENLSALPDGEDQLRLLLDLLVKVCAEFPYIPENDKKRIIQEGIYRDTDFTQLVPRVVWKWMNAQSGKYFREASHQKEEPTANPVTYDELSPETKAKVDGLLRSLQTDKGFRMVPVVTQAEIDAIKIEDLEERNGKESEAVKSGYHTDPNKVLMHNKKMEWIRLYTESDGGDGFKIKEGAPTFEEWRFQADSEGRK